MAQLLGLRPRIPLILFAVFFAASGSIVLAVPAQAHRDGCHRWHSCPSDTGSYVCGDLGYASECLVPVPEPAPGPDHAPAPKDPVEYDFDPPLVPKVGGIRASSGGGVSMTVTAERDSRIDVLNAGGTVVTHATGTGKASLSIRLRKPRTKTR